jgi:hypothetical protein
MTNKAITDTGIYEVDMTLIESEIESVEALGNVT